MRGAANLTLPPATQLPTPWQYDPRGNRHWNPLHNHWDNGPPPKDPNARPSAPKPWEYDSAQNRHWNPDHGHWHSGRPSDGTGKTPEVKPKNAHPEFPLPSLEGRKLSPADYEGKVLLVNFWATWCGPCRQEIPDLIKLYSQYHDQGMEILGVSLDEQGAEVVKPFAERTKINYPVLIGSPKLIPVYSLAQIPVTLVFDRQGRLNQRMIGAQNLANIENVVKPLLNQ